MKKFLIGSLLGYGAYKILTMKKSNKGIVEFGSLNVDGVEGVSFNEEKFKSLRAAQNLDYKLNSVELALFKTLFSYVSTGQITEAQAAYIMATPEVECNYVLKTEQCYCKDPVSYFGRAYGHRKDLGNMGPADGYKYRGRGLVQITGKTNYQKFSKVVGHDLVADPDYALNLDVALKILIYGMMGWEGVSFTRFTLPHYVNDKKTDFWNARRVVNPNQVDYTKYHKKVNRIKSLAEKYLKIFKAL